VGVRYLVTTRLYRRLYSLLVTRYLTKVNGSALSRVSSDLTRLTRIFGVTPTFDNRVQLSALRNSETLGR
jgi:hypothetical protein